MRNIPDKIKTIIENPFNATFFRNASFHGDKNYKILSMEGKEIFAVKTSHGMAYYKLEGSKIGDYTHLHE